MKKPDNPFSWNDTIQKLTEMSKPIQNEHKLVYVNKNATIIKGELQDFTGLVTAYDSLNGIVTIKADDETWIEVIVENIKQDM